MCLLWRVLIFPSEYIRCCCHLRALVFGCPASLALQGRLPWAVFRPLTSMLLLQWLLLCGFYPLGLSSCWICASSERHSGLSYFWPGSLPNSSPWIIVCTCIHFLLILFGTLTNGRVVLPLSKNSGDQWIMVQWTRRGREEGEGYLRVLGRMWCLLG